MININKLYADHQYNCVLNQMSQNDLFKMTKIVEDCAARLNVTVIRFAVNMFRQFLSGRRR